MDNSEIIAETTAAYDALSQEMLTQDSLYFALTVLKRVGNAIKEREGIPLPKEAKVIQLFSKT